SIPVAPVIADIPDATVYTGTPYTGPTPQLTQGTPPITWSLVSGPGGMTINAQTGVVSWPQPQSSSSSYDITINAKNSVGSDQATWQLTVLDPVPPVIAEIPDATISAGTPYTGPLPALVQGSPTVTWTLAAGPDGMSINASNGLVYWPSPVDTGSPHLVTI